MSIQRARALRRQLSAPEARLWNAVRNEQLRHLHFRRQVPIGPYYADFASHAAKLIIEVDGSQHAADDAIAYDARRTAFLESRGYRVLRVPAGEVLNNLQAVFDAILGAASTPSPPAAPVPPPRKGEGAGD
ncbi:MAG TPA: DUF559 domain-containing protein [Devosia sp.]|nr:DUF559 domain-containing protein [Devosia sp.]